MYVGNPAQFKVYNEDVYSLEMNLLSRTEYTYWLKINLKSLTDF